MTILGLLVRFFALYVVAAAVLLYIFRDLTDYWLQSGLLIAVIYGLSRMFVRRNHRNFTPGERVAVIFVVVSMDILLQIFRMSLHFFYMAEQTGGLHEVSAFQAFFGLVCLIIIHLFAVIYLLKLAKSYASEIGASQ